MKVINIILILLLILFIILNLYHVFYVRKTYLNKELQENFIFSDTYTDENIDSSTFQYCDPSINSECTNTYTALENNSADFMNNYSRYDTNYSLSNIQNTSHEYRKYNDIMTNKSILAYRCLKKSPKELQQILNTLQNPIPSLYKKIYLYDEQSLNQYIEDQLNNITNVVSQEIESNNMMDNSETSYTMESFQEHFQINSEQIKIDLDANKNTSKLLGPVYICISQAPYIKYNGDMIKARFDVTNNQRAYYIEERINNIRRYDLQTGNGTEDKLSSLYTEILFIFPMYKIKNTENGTTTIEFANENNRNNNFISYITQYFVQDKLCFMKCNKSELSCGCLNANSDDMNTNNNIHIASDVSNSTIKQYTSVCYDHNTIKTNYSILYYLNPYGNTNDKHILNLNRST